MTTNNLTTGEEAAARVEARLAELKDTASVKGGVSRYMSEFDLAEIFADRFSSVFMAEKGGAGTWYFRLAPGSEKPRKAYCEARHACVRMISLLTNAGEADIDDKARLQRWRTVLNVIEIASWDPRLAYSAGHSDDRPAESRFDLPSWARDDGPGDAEADR